MIKINIQILTMFLCLNSYAEQISICEDKCFREESRNTDFLSGPKCQEHARHKPQYEEDFKKAKQPNFQPDEQWSKNLKLNSELAKACNAEAKVIKTEILNSCKQKCLNAESQNQNIAKVQTNIDPEFLKRKTESLNSIERQIYSLELNLESTKDENMKRMIQNSLQLNKDLQKCLKDITDETQLRKCTAARNEQQKSFNSK